MTGELAAYLGLVLGLPVAVGVAVTLILRRWRLNAIGALAAVVFAVSFVAETGMPSIPPSEKWKALPTLTIAIAIISVLGAASRRFGSIPCLSTAFGLAFGLLFTMPVWSPVDRALAVLAAAILCASLESLFRRCACISLPASVSLALLGLGTVFFFSGFATLVLPCVASAIAAAIGSLGARSLRGTGAALAALLLGIALCGDAYDQENVPRASWLLLLLAPHSLWLGQLPAMGWLRGSAATGARITLAAALVAIAIVLASRGHISSDGTDDSEDADPMQGIYGAVPH